MLNVLLDFVNYFTALANDRRVHLTGDLASVIANAEIDGEPLADLDMLGHYVIIATAGHDTTSSAIAGGLLALIEYPDQLQLLREQPELIDAAADEIIRYVSPVKHFMRNCQEPFTLRDVTFQPGELLYLSFASANRDEDVFHGRAPGSTYGARTRRATSRSASAATSVSAPTSPAWRSAPSSRSSWRASTTSSWRANRGGPRPTSWKAPRASRSPTGSADMQHPKHFAQTAPDRTAVVIGDTGERLTYRELDRRSNQVAHALRAAGLHTGDHVAAVLDNRLEFFETLWGAMRAGLYFTPVNWHLSADEISYVVDDCGATRLFVAGDATDAVTGLGRDAGRLRLAVGGDLPGFDDYEQALAAQPVTPVDDECEGSWMFYSSGTTGRPKGVKPPTIGAELGAPTVFSGLVGGLYGCSEGIGVPQPGAALPRGAGGLVDDRAAPRRHRRGDEHLRSGHLSRADRALPRHPRAVRADALRAVAEARRRDARQVRPVEPRGRRARGRAVPARREARRDRVVRTHRAGVLLRQRGRRVLRDHVGGVAGAPRLGRPLAARHRAHRRRGRARGAHGRDRPGVVRGLEPVRVPRRPREDRGARSTTAAGRRSATSGGSMPRATST